MVTITGDTLTDRIKQKLLESHPDELFIPDEIHAVVQALYNYLRWSILFYAQQNKVQEVSELETVNHFSRSATNQELIDAIENTSGLDQVMSLKALEAIEEMVDQALINENEEPVELEYFGVISVKGAGYHIKLSPYLALTPVKHFITIMII